MTHDIPHPAPASRISLLEYSIVVYGAALVLALIALALPADTEAGAWLLITPPVVTAVVGFASRSREVLWLAIGACLSIGILAIVSVGFVLLQVALCLFGWWHVSSRRLGRPVFVRPDLWWGVAGIVPFLIFALGLR